MGKRVLNVGQCAPDHQAIRALIEGQFDATVVRTHHRADTIDALHNESFDLILVNRKLDVDTSDGMEIIRWIKSDPKCADIPCMLISNYPEHQAAAVSQGAIPGFGKEQLKESTTHDRLAQVLSRSDRKRGG